LTTAQDVTLYVPCYAADATIGEVVAGILAQTATPGRVLLVDDGSPRPLAAPPGVELVRHPHNLGLAAARNTALGLCETALIASLDSDVVPSPTWLETLLAAFNRGGVHGVAGRLDERHHTSPADHWRATHMAQHWGDAELLDPRFLYGANTLFLADALRALGGYDPTLRTNYEDMSTCLALYAQGKHLRYTPAARCEHLRVDTSASILPGYWKWHHAKGLLRGDFDSQEGLLRRVEDVNFGIFQYRFDLDVEQGRADLLALDLLLPWVFCALDLRLGAQRGAFTGTSPFPPPAGLEGLVPEAKTFPGYLERVQEAAARHGWEELRRQNQDSN